MIYHYEQNQRTDVNKLLVLTSTLHSIYSMSQHVKKSRNTPQVIKLKLRYISIYRTLTNTTFIFVSDHKLLNVFEKIYHHYCDFVLKNPFYIDDMPINCAKFQPSLLF